VLASRTYGTHSVPNKNSKLSNSFATSSLSFNNIKEPFIRSVNGTACKDQLFEANISAYGPYKDEATFNEGIVTALKDALISG
jgi:hypothetical protein